MNANINLVELLKDCPKGTEFYSPVCGIVTFDHIEIALPYSIRTINDIQGEITFTKEGKFFKNSDGECLIFPSKDQRDWNVWYENFVKGKTKEAFQSFKDGDYIHFNTGNTWTVIYRKTDELEVRGYACQSNDYISVMEDKGYVGTKPYAYNVRLATPKEIAQLDNALARLKKRWNPTTKEVEVIKTEMTISEIEKKLGLTSGSLRIKK